jgi:hypothetical protein
MVLALVLWALCLAIDVAGVAEAIRLWRERPSGGSIKAATRVYLAFTIVVMVLALTAVLIGALSAFGVIGGESYDPSQKARTFLGISEAINVTAFGTLAATPLAIAVMIYARIRQRR